MNNMSLRQNFIRKMHIPAILQEEFMSILFLCFSIGLSLSLYLPLFLSRFPLWFRYFENLLARCTSRTGNEYFSS